MDPITSAGGGGGGGYSYPDSVDSSPRSRGGESWDEPFPSSAAAAASSKLRLMCSYGGRIVPRPTDKSLCYLGGETRIVVVDRLSSLADLQAKLSRSLLGNRPFTLKYQLPNEDLDSLISVSTDEDLENMIEEYDRILAAGVSSSTGAPPSAAAKSSRIRLFLFPESAPSSVGSLLDDSKTETWFVDALNGAMGGIGVDGLPRGSTDSASVNCLLGLDDDEANYVRARAGGGDGREQVDPSRMGLSRPDSSSKLGRNGGDVQSVPESPVLETNSSFGSASSGPVISNLPPIRVRPDDRPPDHRYGNIDDHFQQMNISQNPPPPVPPQVISNSAPTMPPAEIPCSNRQFSSEGEKPDLRKQQQPVLTQQQMQKPPATVEAPISDSRTIYYQESMPPPPAIPELKREIPVPDPVTAYRVQQTPVPGSGGYVLPTIPPQPEPQQQLHPHTYPQHHPQQHPHAPLQAHPPPQLQPQQQQQQQFIPANHQFVPITSYYQVPHPIQQSQPYDPSVPMYYIPVPQNPPPPAVPAVPPPKVATKPEIQPNLYRTPAQPAPVIHMAADHGHPTQVYAGMGYHVMPQHLPPQTQASAPVAVTLPQSVANYRYSMETAHTAQAQAQVQAQQAYYAQTTMPPSMPPQYQTVMTEAGQQTLEVKQNRGS